jgi:hypothetical protein
VSNKKYTSKSNAKRRKSPSQGKPRSKAHGQEIGTGFPSLDQFAHLADGDLQGAQKHALAEEISRSYGNRSFSQALRDELPVLQRSPVAGIDPAATNFWTRLEDLVAQDLINWLANRHGAGVRSFESDLRAREEGSVGAFMLESSIQLIGLVPTGGNVAAAVANIARGVYKLLPTDSPVSLEDFMFQARLNIEEISTSISTRGHELFDRIRSAHDSETDENRTEVREGIISELDAALDALPTLVQTERALIVDWINSSQDSWDLGDWGGMEAGNIYVSYRYWPHIGDGLWGIASRPYIDDVSRPEGTKTALQHVFGENTFLHERPFQMNVRIQPHTLTGTTRGSAPSGESTRIIKPQRTSMTWEPGPATWNLDSGSESVLRAWEATTSKPRIRDLVSD